MTASAFVRAFMAVAVDDETRCRLVAVQQAFKATRAHVSWVRPANIHLSFAFLGDVLRDDVPVICEALDDIVKDRPQFCFGVTGVGTFGRGSPRVIWAGVHECDALITLQAAVSDTLRGLGLELETRPYRPHITLGRVRSGRGRSELVAALSTFPEASYGMVSVSTVDFMQSRLMPGGAEYCALHRCPLSGAGP
jgi:RNA 2',3'-cyclic 3'-phosphodiesterase